MYFLSSHSLLFLSFVSLGLYSHLFVFALYLSTQPSHLPWPCIPLQCTFHWFALWLRCYWLQYMLQCYWAQALLLCKNTFKHTHEHKMIPQTHLFSSLFLLSATNSYHSRTFGKTLDPFFIFSSFLFPPGLHRYIDRLCTTQRHTVCLHVQFLNHHFGADF